MLIEFTNEKTDLGRTRRQSSHRSNRSNTITMTTKVILAIDPGTAQSAWCVWDSATSRLLAFGIESNLQLKQALPALVRSHNVTTAGVEMIASYGMPVGAEIFETVLFIGGVVEQLRACVSEVSLVYRQQQKLHICGSNKANDSSIRQALIDRFGVVGTKKSPGFFYGVTKDVWAAVAVAVVVGDTLAKRPGVSDAGPLRFLQISPTPQG